MAPGGLAHVEWLTDFARDRGGANTAEGPMARLRRWQMARQRAKIMGISDLNKHEQMRVCERLSMSIESLYLDCNLVSVVCCCCVLVLRWVLFGDASSNVIGST